uniref:VWFA domain-containing protein n=1 Tax=Strigamia maritima TaxID=126957 RepID=T1J717_STRMM
MNQRAFLGGRPTLLDVAKGAVETFLKIRQKDPISRGDRYMLMTFEDPPANIKAGWKENHATFMNELKNLQATGQTTLGAALKNAFDVLNINRMQTGIDTYGQGRCPFYLEPSVIIVITDGGNLSTNTGVQEELNLPMHPNIPGSELTREPFRWDQRLFSLVLRISGTPSVEKDCVSLVPSDNSPVDAMCEVTGGRSYAVTSQRMLMQCLESLVQKVQSGVVINFEKVGADPPSLISDVTGLKNGDGSLPELMPNGDDHTIRSKLDDFDQKNEFQNSKILNQNGTITRPSSPIGNNTTAWHTCRKLIYVQRSAQKGYSVGHWPIPEAFWPDINSPALPPRTAHPVLKFTCTNSDPMVIDNLPFDKYELEPSPLTQFILSRKQPTVCWQVYVTNSYKNCELGYPFGYLKASTNLNCVNLFVMPYNYPVLLPLLDDLFKIHRLKPTREWRQQFENYLKNMPLYYAGPLKRALVRMGAPNLVPDNMENCLSYSVLNYLKRLKNQAKAEYERLLVSVSNNTNNPNRSQAPEGIRVIPRSPFRKEYNNLTSNPALSERFSSLKDQINDYSPFTLIMRDKEIPMQSYRNPFDILRSNLLDQIARMRSNFLQTAISNIRLQDNDQRHNMPVGQMGNYQEYLKRMPQPLREIESAPVRQHMFGNPFKIDKRMMVDEADIDLVSGGSGPHGRGTKRPPPIDSPPGSPRPGKRKPGPLPRDIPIRRPQTPPILNSGLTPPPPDLRPSVDLEKDLLGAAGLKFGMNSENLQMPELTMECNRVDYSPVQSGESLSNHLDVFSAGSTQMKLLDKKQAPIVNHCPVPDSKFHKENTRLKRLTFTELRKPGRNFTQLFAYLRSMEGSVQLRVSMVRDVITEALRLKRKSLIEQLEKYEQSLLSNEHNHKIVVSPTR